jgi:hypothetical protein
MKNVHNRADNALTPYRLAPRVHVYSEITPVVLDAESQCIFIPFHSNDAIVQEYVRSHSFKKSADIIAFYHGAVNGAIMNTVSRTICHDSEISEGTLARGFKRTFLGHFHTHGAVGGASSRVVYVGAPIQSNIGEAGDLDHGFIHYMPNKDEWKLVRNPDASYFVKILWGEWSSGLNINGKRVQLEIDTDLSEIDPLEIKKAREKLYKQGAEMVEVKYRSKRKPEIGIQRATTYLPKDIPTTTIEEMVNSFMKNRNLSSPVEINPLLEKQRHDYFLEFIKEQYLDSPSQAQISASSSMGSFQGNLLRISMHNFRGIKGTAVLEINSLPQSDIFLVSGPNGSGKSTLIEAVVWCHFGEFVSSGIPVEDIIHDNLRECWVQCDYANGYSFRRWRKGKGKAKIGFEIIDPTGTVQEHGHDSKSNTRYLCDNVIHMNLGMFKQVVVIGDNAEYFVRAVGDKERTECLDVMFGLDSLTEYRDKLAAIVKVGCCTHPQDIC